MRFFHFDAPVSLHAWPVLKTRFPRILLFLLGAVLLAGGGARSSSLSLEERVEAQEAMQRVYYSHQIGATDPFEKVFPRELLEGQVRDYLKQSDLLERYWHTRVTSAALHAELERIARHSRLPERLQEIYAALDSNPVLIEECFARRSLVDRLARSLFSADERFHSDERAQAEALRERLAGGDLSAETADPHRSVAEVVLDSTREGTEERAILIERDDGRPATAGNSLPAEEFGKWRATLPATIGDAGPLQDRRDAFEFQVILSEEPGRLRVATYSFPKQSWTAWWESNRDSFHEESVPAVAPRAEMIQWPPANSSGASRFAAVLASSHETELPLSSIPSEHHPPNLAPGPVTVTATSCLQPSWDNGILDDLPEPRYNHTAVWTGSRMIIWGGTSLTATGFSYDPLIDTWQPISSLNAPSSRTQHTAIWTGTRMIVWGGNGYLNTGGMYDPSSDTWTATSTSGAPLGRVEHTAVWTGTEMLVFGGLASQTSPIQSGGRFNPATNAWAPMAFSPTARFDHTAVWTGSEMLVWGGASASTYLSAPIKYNPATDTWSPFGSVNQPAARARHGAVWTGSRMIIWGGQSGGFNLTSGGQYDSASDSWIPTSSTNAPYGYYPASFWTGSEMLTWSWGAGRRYNPVADIWTTLPTVNAPSGYNGWAAVWTGSEMIVWGGTPSLGGPLGTGARYKPATDAWTPTSFLTPPSSRQLHTAVWTGNRMIIWGGRGSSSGIFNTGGQYDPLSDTWIPTSTVNAPIARADHSAVWTGSRMVIWGGNSDGFSVVLSSGGRYDPASDTWTATSLVNAPQGRNRPTALWTGSKMIVWGGVIPGSPQAQYVNTGGIYDLALDTWSLTSTLNAPEGRSEHAAVWTGSRMVVWGGHTSPPPGSPGRYLNTGGQYNPSTDQWTPTSIVAAPIARAAHAFVWTGSRMIVWGGQPGNGRGSVFTGGRYDPLTDQWTSMSTTGAPHSRHSPTAVWTGSQMIVWGGISEVTTSVNSGGVYDPALDQWIAATPSSGAPRARYRHTAVWTGSQMIVWGGYIGIGDAQNGGRLRLDLLPDADADLDGFGACSGDCHDFDATIHPGATEVCNGLDDNCSAGADEPFDQDQDGFATCGGDCNDSDPAINPPAAEICDHIDENCNSILDDGFPDADVDTWAACVDCNDNNNQIFPGQGDSCNGIDDDCDGVIDQWGNATCPPSTCHPGICGGLAGCLPSPVGTSCNDGNLCTQVDACNASGSCVGGSPAVGTPCNDGNLCTQTDTCNASGSCVGSPVVCPLPDCWSTSSCAPATGLCSYSNPKPNGTACSDGNSCTIGDTCAVGLCTGGPLRDADSDAYSDAACGGNDCNDSNSQVWSVPMEVMILALTTVHPANPSWNSLQAQAGWETVYDLTSGILDGSGGINTASATCLQSGSGATSYSDARADPALGAGYWYLVRAKNSCGTGTYGADSNDTPRTIPTCP
jgi:N-acetylneuraminic acid mutarotase